MSQWENADGWEEAGWEDAEDAPFSKQLKTAAKQGLAGLGNNIDRAWSGLAGGLADLVSGPDEADKIFKAMRERVASREAFANEDGVKPGITASVIGSLPSLPGQVVALPLNVFETGQRSLEMGEDLPTAQRNQVIRGGGNFAALATAPFGGSLATKAATGAGMNVLQDYVTGHLLADSSSTEAAKKEFTPTKEGMAQSAILGALMGPMVGGKPKSKKKTVSDVGKKLEALDAKEIPPAPELGQLELPLENTAQQIAERRAAEMGQLDLFGPINEAQRVDVAQVDPRRMPGIETVRQGELFDQPEMGRVANPYEAALGDWRVDENGIPVKVDLSMEAQNLENPLQRNLWGDELPQRMNPVGQNATLLDQNGLQQGIPLTEAIDSMPWAQKRGAINSQLRGEVPATGELQGAVAEANRRVPNSQRGAINMEMFDPAYEKIKMLANGIRLKITGSETGPTVTATKDGKLIGHMYGESVNWADPKPTDNLESAGTYVSKDFQRQGIATEMYKFLAENGNDIVPSKAQMADGKAMWKGFEKKGLAQNRMIKRGQRGGVDFESIAEGINNVVERITNRFKPPVTKEDAAAKLPGMKRAGRDLIYVPEAGSLLAEQAKAESDGPSLFERFQAGLDHASEKTGSTLMKGAAQWLQYARRMADFDIRESVIPLEKAFTSLSTKEMIDLMEVNRVEMFKRKQYTPEQLASVGLNKKQIATYKQFREAQTKVLETVNKGRVALGKEPVTPQNAYLSSVFQGDYHIAVKNKEGKLVWYIQQANRRDANAAIKWLKENGEGLDLSDLKVQYKPRPFADVPRDVIGTYQEALKMFPEDDPVAQRVRALMEEYATQKGNTFLGQNLHHVDKKQNVRGFMGDQPWLDPKKNAYNQAHAQIQYMKDSYRWAHMQEALTQLKPMLSDPELVKNQPNNMSITKAYVMNNMGVSKNVLKGLENVLAESLGKSSSLVPGIVRDLKGVAYTMQLGASVGYMIATPFQLVPGLAAWHTKLGFNLKNFYHDLTLTISDGIIGMMHDLGKDATGNKWDTTSGMTDFGKEAYRWAEANGVFSANLFDENAGLGAHKIIAEGQNAIGYTISKPDQMSRWMAFLSFARHLENSPEFKGNRDAMFQRASELTEHVATDMHRQARPLVVDQFGFAGEAVYMYRAPQVNMLNTLSIFARQAKNGNPMPLMVYLGAMAMMGGVLNLPGVQEVDDGWELFKDWVAENKPHWYKSIENVGIKQFILSNMSDTSVMGQVTAWGGASVLSGANMASRFSQEVIDLKDPLSGFSPLGQELKEWMGIGKFLVNPNEDTAVQAVHDAAMPPLGQGLMQSYLPQFKSGVNAQDGSWTGYKNPRDLTDDSTLVKRSPREEDYKKLGLTALSEAQRRTKDYIANQESARVGKAQEAAIDKLFSAIRRDDPEDVEKFAKAYFALYGDTDRFLSALNTKIQRLGMTPGEFQKAHINSLRSLSNVVRRLEMDQGNK